MERYKGYLVPISCIKTGSLLQQLAAREQTTSQDILNSATKSELDGPETVGPLTSTEELLKALDSAIGSDNEELKEFEPREPESISTKAEIEGSDQAEVAIPKKKKRRTKSETETDGNDPKFVELTRLLPPVPERGNFEVDTVKKSLYFFS